MNMIVDGIFIRTDIHPPQGAIFLGAKENMPLPMKLFESHSRCIYHICFFLSIISMTQPEEGNWKLFCDANPEICQLPADPLIIAVYFNNLLVSNGYRDDAAYYGIRCHH